MSVIVDDILLREPNLLTPGRKPVGPVKIDWESDLAPRLACWLFDSAYSIRSITDNAQSDIVGANRHISTSVRGRAFYYSVRNTNYEIAVPTVISNSGSYTFEWIAKYPATYTDLTGATNNTNYMFDIQTDRFAIGADSVVAPNLGFYDTAWTSTGYEPTGNGLQHIHFVFDGVSGTATLYVNGIQKYTGLTYTARNFTSGDAALFNWNTGNFFPAPPYTPINLEIYSFNIHDKALNAGQVYASYRDPYQFLIPA